MTGYSRWEANATTVLSMAKAMAIILPWLWWAKSPLFRSDYRVIELRDATKGQGKT